MMLFYTLISVAALIGIIMLLQLALEHTSKDTHATD